MVNLNFLKTFIILSENLSFSKTAKLLNTSQPVVSRQIKVLEEKWNTTLFMRTKKSVILTDQGREYLKKLRPIVKQLEEEITGTSLTSELQIGSLFEVGEIYFLPLIVKAYKKFQSEYLNSQKMKVHLDYNSANQIYIDLLEGRMDVILTYLENRHKSIVSKKIITDRAVLIANKDFNLKLELDLGLKYVSYRKLDLFAQNFINKNFKKNEIEKMINVFSVNSHKSMVNFVSENIGIAAVMPLSSYLALNDKKTQIIKKDLKDYELFIQYHESLQADKFKISVINYLIEEFKSKKIVH